MYIFIFLLTLWILLKTISYGIFEIKQNNNKTSGIIVIFIAIIASILPNIMLYIFGES